MCEIQKCLPLWEAIGTNQTVLEWIEKGVPLPFTTLPPITSIPNRSLSQDQVSFIDQEISDLLHEGFIERCLPDYVLLKCCFRIYTYVCLNRC